MSFWNLKNKTVLIIDDFPEMRSMLFSMLKNYEPKEVVQAGNGEDAIELIARRRFDIIMCDYNLGEGKDGQQVLEEAKYRKILPYYTLFIMVTAENTNAMVMGAAEYMPDSYLSKPINKNVLLSRLQKLLLKKETLRPLSDALEKEDANEAIKRCDELLEKNVKFKFEVLKIKSEQLLNTGKFDEALGIAKAVLSERKIPWAMMLIAKVMMHKKDYSNAEIEIKSLLETDKNFMPAYDALAEIMEINENFNEAQNVLMDAVKISPKSIIRQRALADVLDINDEKNLLEKTRRKVVNIGKSSCLKQPADYTKLAKVYVDNGTPNKAVDVLNQTSKVFKGDDKVLLESKVQLVDVYKKTGNTSKYRESLDTSLKLLNKDTSLLDAESVIDLARACIDLGKADEAKDMVTLVVKEFYEDKTLMDSVAKMYADAGLEDEGKELMSVAKGEVVALNNEGVALINKGKIDEAVKLFKFAVHELPNNLTINLNVAMALYLHMKNSGFDSDTQQTITDYLQTVFNKDPDNAKAKDLKSKCMLLGQ